MVITQRTDLSCWSKASLLNASVELAAFVFPRGTRFIVPTPRIGTSASRALVFGTERPCRRYPEQTSFRGTGVATTVVPESASDGQDFETAISGCAGMVPIIPSSSRWIFGALLPPTYMLLTPILAFFFDSDAGCNAAFVDLAITAFRFCSGVA
ncbi:hypothetical protein E0Z10_g8402 [Xylaria hypoxylon]|uniref:Uncharacterized protein n=1 Tax=Xylaria hypoxylon TaxID=37992 RepID=A0A4Z0YBF6_9PEZI|nr:hypothetical protein E0Z10_g8402 [Xylaria hypoxylon]